MNERQLKRFIQSKLKIGEVIKTHKFDFREGQEYTKRLIIGFYPHHVLTVNPENGDFECYVYADMLKFVKGIKDDSGEDT